MGAGRGFPSLQLWCLVLFLAFSLVCSARQTVASLPGNHRQLRAKGGSAVKGSVRTDDYNDPSANPGHDPKTGGGVVKGRRSL